MPLDINPYAPAKAEAEERLANLRHRVQDFFKTFTTATLLKSLGGSVAGIALAVINFPIFAIVAVTVVIVALSVYAIYSTKIMRAQECTNQWAYVEGKRVQQRVLDAEVAMDTVTLALMGERHAPAALRSASPELRSALAYYQHRLRLAEERAAAAEAVRDGTATDRQRRALARARRRDVHPERQAAPPQGPKVEPIKARRAALDAERKELEAEIKSLATADSIAQAMRTEEVQGTRKTRRELEEAARKAHQAARERVRAGREPTRPDPEHSITLSVGPNGDRDVASGRGTATPEQIAKGEDQADPDAA